MAFLFNTLTIFRLLMKQTSNPENWKMQICFSV